jgi:predicted GNAT family acetyltransferase
MPSAVHSTTDPQAFLASSGDFLGARPVEHSIILTNAAHAHLEGVWTSVVRDGQVVAASMVTPPHTLQVSLAGDDDLLALAHHHHAAGRRLPGVGGMRRPASAFAGHWSRLCGATVSERMALGVFVCDEVVATAPPAGFFRAARAADEEQLVRWGRRFIDEIAHGVEEDAGIAARIRSGQVHVWERDGQIVSMAALSSRERGYSRVQLVYTPREQRGRGYASACVSELVQQEMAAGGRCMLYTNLANPVSNKVYQAIGFRRVSEAVTLEFA